MKRTYSNGKITVFWDSDRCIGAGECHRQLLEVFNPERRPWVILDGADPETIKGVIDCCPSGALRCEVCDDHHEKVQQS